MVTFPTPLGFCQLAGVVVVEIIGGPTIYALWPCLWKRSHFPNIVALSGAHTLVTSSTDLQLSLKSSFSTRTYACSFCLVWCCREGHISKFQALMASGQRSPGSSTIRISSKVSFENSLIGTHINAAMFQLYMMAICYD